VKEEGMIISPTPTKPEKKCPTIPIERTKSGIK
jgi:hypothetical protein